MNSYLVCGLTFEVLFFEKSPICVHNFLKVLLIKISQVSFFQFFNLNKISFIINFTTLSLDVQDALYDHCLFTSRSCSPREQLRARSIHQSCLRNRKESRWLVYTNIFYFFPIIFINHLFIYNYFVSVCMDGSPGGYHHSAGSGDGARNWLLYLMVIIISNLIYFTIYNTFFFYHFSLISSIQGGGWCADIATCQSYFNITKGSSRFSRFENFTGILSPDKHINPGNYKFFN